MSLNFAHCLLHCGARRRGFGYIAILLLVALISTMGLLFLERTSTQETEASNRTQNIQATYLAETGVNEAMWRLLNDSTFPAQANLYYMYALNGGRYGYRVRRHTDTKFATISAVGAMGSATAFQSNVVYVLPPAAGSALNLLYDTTTGSGDSYPWRRQFRNTIWQGASQTVDITGTSAYWVDVVSNPARGELLMGTIDQNNHVKFATFDGSMWSGTFRITTTGNNVTKTFAMGYESISGRAVVVSRQGTSSSILYSIWDGSTWSTAAAGPVLASGVPVVMAMASNPTNNEILLSVVNDLSDLQVFRWNGSTFSSLGVLETNLTASSLLSPCVIAYERLAGRAVIVWGKNGIDSCQYAVWSGSSLSSTGSVPSFDSATRMLRAASDPTSNQIFIVGVTQGSQMHASIWTGSSFNDSNRFEDSMASNNLPIFDVVWLSTGNSVMVAWNRLLELTARYAIWSKGNSLGSVSSQAGPGLTLLPQSIRLVSFPKINKVDLLMTDTLATLFHSVWAGGSFSAPAQVAATLCTTDRMPYAAATIKQGS